LVPYVQERINNLIQRHIDVGQRLPEGHWGRPDFLNLIQSITHDSDIPTTSTLTDPQSQPKLATQSSDPSILEELANHYSSELPSFKPNSKIAFEEVVSHQQEPNSKIATNTYTELIIHPEYQPYHLNATHSNISFGIALRKLANKKSSTSNLPTSDDQPSSSENQILVVQPISVAQPSTETTLNPAEPEQMIIEHVVNEVPTQIRRTLASSSSFVLEHVNDPPFVPNQTIATESNTSTIINSEPSSSFTPQLTDLTVLPTLLLDSAILKEACEQIFLDLNKLVKTRNHFIHEKDYVSEWISLRNRVEYMMCELHKLSLEAHDKALLDLQQLFKGVTVNMEEIELNKTLEKSKLYLSDTPMYLDASSISSSSVHYENPDFKWLTKLKILTSDAPILEKLKDGPVLEKENKELKKAMFEHKVLVSELQRKMLDQHEQARIREKKYD